MPTITNPQKILTEYRDHKSELETLYVQYHDLVDHYYSALNDMATLCEQALADNQNQITNIRQIEKYRDAMISIHENVNHKLHDIAEKKEQIFQLKRNNHDDISSSLMSSDDSFNASEDVHNREFKALDDAYYKRRRVIETRFYKSKILIRQMKELLCNATAGDTKEALEKQLENERYHQLMMRLAFGFDDRYNENLIIKLTEPQQDVIIPSLDRKFYDYAEFRYEYVIYTRQDVSRIKRLGAQNKYEIKSTHHLPRYSLDEKSSKSTNNFLSFTLITLALGCGSLTALFAMWSRVLSSSAVELHTTYSGYDRINTHDAAIAAACIFAVLTLILIFCIVMHSVHRTYNTPTTIQEAQKSYHQSQNITQNFLIASFTLTMCSGALGYFAVHKWISELSNHGSLSHWGGIPTDLYTSVDKFHLGDHSGIFNAHENIHSNQAIFLLTSFCILAAITALIITALIISARRQQHFKHEMEFEQKFAQWAHENPAPSKPKDDAKSKKTTALTDTTKPKVFPSIYPDLTLPANHPRNAAVSPHSSGTIKPDATTAQLDANRPKIPPRTVHSVNADAPLKPTEHPKSP